MADLKAEFQYYLDHKASFEKEYLGKYIVLKDHKVIGVYDDPVQAVTETQKTHQLGTFLVQHVNESDVQVRFHSRYSIAK